MDSRFLHKDTKSYIQNELVCLRRNILQSSAFKKVWKILYCISALLRVSQIGATLPFCLNYFQLPVIYQMKYGIYLHKVFPRKRF